LIDFNTRIIVLEDGSVHTVFVPKSWHFDKDASRKVHVRMIIVHELPFIHIEREDFVIFEKLYHVDFVIPSRYMTVGDCYAIFINERKKMKSVFQKLYSKICFTIDT